MKKLSKAIFTNISVKIIADVNFGGSAPSLAGETKVIMMTLIPKKIRTTRIRSIQLNGLVETFP